MAVVCFGLLLCFHVKQLLFKSSLMVLKKFCVKHNVIPHITLTTVNHSCIDSTIPILFDQRTRHLSKMLKHAMKNSWIFSRSIRILPYRLSSTKMSEFFKDNKDTSLVKFIGDLKKVSIEMKSYPWVATTIRSKFIKSLLSFLEKI